MQARELALGNLVERCRNLLTTTMLGDIRLLSVGRRSLSMNEKSMSGCSLTDEARQAAEAKLSPDGDGPRMYGARRIKSTSELEAGRPLGRQYLSPSTKTAGALAAPRTGGANDSDVLFVTILEVRSDFVVIFRRCLAPRYADLC